MPEPNGVEKTIAEAGSVQNICDLWGINRQSFTEWRRRGYFPLDRAKDAAQRWGVPLREMVSPSIRDAMDAAT